MNKWTCRKKLENVKQLQANNILTLQQPLVRTNPVYKRRMDYNDQKSNSSTGSTRIKKSQNKVA